MTPSEETIAAVATPVGRAGIGIVRISGPRAVEIAEKIFKAKSGVRRFQPRRLYLGRIFDPASGEDLDEVLLSFMKAPRSYTREDVVEINSHSGYLLLSKVLQIILDQGARLANPGEFTLRAFLNGRMDLTQAEAVVDLINAQSERGLHLASEQIGGSFAQEIEKLRLAVIDILSLAEVSIDFPDEEVGPVDQALAGRIEEALSKVRSLLQAHARKRVWIDGVKTVIAGRVNAGKSSLLNRLLEEERALVTPVPGTTRDFVESTVTIEGLPLRLIDTAGFRKTKNEVEKAGMSLSEKKLSEADLVLLVLDQARPSADEDLALLQRVRAGKALVVLNKIDLPAKLSAPPEGWGLPVARISALTGEGIDPLRRAIRACILEGGMEADASHAAPNLRHKGLLTEASEFFESAAKGAREQAPMELVAVDLKSGLDALDEILGKRTSGEILDRIFSQFCLGK